MRRLCRKRSTPRPRGTYSLASHGARTDADISTCPVTRTALRKALSKSPDIRGRASTVLAFAHCRRGRSCTESPCAFGSRSRRPPSRAAHLRRGTGTEACARFPGQAERRLNPAGTARGARPQSITARCGGSGTRRRRRASWAGPLRRALRAFAERPSECARTPPPPARRRGYRTLSLGTRRDEEGLHLRIEGPELGATFTSTPVEARRR
jgi:hypothetical protein